MIQEITKKKAAEIIEKRELLGNFYLYEDDRYVGIDNRTGDAWTEEFDTKEKCIDWLNGRFEVGDRT